MPLHYVIVLKFHLFVYSVISGMFWPVLCHHQGNHSCTMLDITASFIFVSYKCWHEVHIILCV